MSESTDELSNAEEAENKRLENEAAAEPEEAAALGHYGIQPLHDFDRSHVLGPLADYIPSKVEYQHWLEPCGWRRGANRLSSDSRGQHAPPHHKSARA